MQAHAKSVLFLAAALFYSGHTHAFGARAPLKGTKLSAKKGTAEVIDRSLKNKKSDSLSSGKSSQEKNHRQSENESEAKEEKKTASSLSLKDEIRAIVQDSACKNESWENRGLAPESYMLGMALSFARSLGRVRVPSEVGQALSGKASFNSSRDALSHYEAEFAKKNMEISFSGTETLKSLYTLGLGLGMRESSGKYCEGFDASVSDQKAWIAEAGLFQFSYDSRAASSLLTDLYNEYRVDPSRCFLAEFSHGVSCKTQSIVGSGPGAAFQEFTKKCPAFAAEYAMLALRVLRKHFGPINRKEAELKSSCYEMFGQVSDLASMRDAELVNF